ncbi:MAG: hypothetical protein Kow00127_19100 [Bacteroidales bacterium]
MKIRMSVLKRIGLVLVSVVVTLSPARSQEKMSFSLREAQVYALEHNYDIRNALIDIEMARKKVKEQTAIGFPQIDATVSYTNYLDIPTQLIPDFISPAVMAVNENIYGLSPVVEVPSEPRYFETQFGIQHNATWGATLNQLIFSGKYIVGLQAAKAYLSLSQTSLAKSQIEIRDAVAKAYFPVVILQENRKVFDSTLTNLKKMRDETLAFYQTGFVEETDVDQINLLISDMENTLSNLDNQLEISVNTFKFLLGLDENIEVEFTDKLDDLISSFDPNQLLMKPFDIQAHIDYKIMKNQEAVKELMVSLNRSEYLPSINGFYSYQENAMRDNFNFFDFTKSWYPNQMIGIQMNIPIWSSGARKYKVQQAKLDLEKVRIQDEMLRHSLPLKVRTARSEFNNAYLIYNNKKMALENAKKIYDRNRTKYAEGMVTSLALAQSYNQYLTSQIDMLTSALNMLTKKSELEKELTDVRK